MCSCPGSECRPGDCPIRVDPDQVIMEAVAIIQNHTIMDENETLTMCLWCLNAHVHDLGQHSPYLAFQSPTMRCGKTTALGVMAALTPRPIGMAHVTGASLFRLIDEHNPTVLVDELDQIIDQNAALRTVLNAGHNRQTAAIPRVEKGRTRLFRVFSPKVMACIGTLPGTLQDRSLVINLRRKRPDQHVIPLPRDPAATYVDTRRKIMRWTQDNYLRIAMTVPDIPAGLNDRAVDNWRPLLTIAKVLGPHWAAMAAESAVKISRINDAESVYPSEQLIRDIQRVFQAGKGVKMVAVDQLHEALVNLDASPWQEFERDQPLTKARLGRMLKPFGIVSTTARVRGRVIRVYLLADFQDAFSRYCVGAN